MRARRTLAALAGAAALVAAGASTAGAQQLEGVVQHMTCVAPHDAAGIDAMLARASSPLAGEGATFVSESLAAGIDPRALVAIAAHETMLETYVPSQAINNAFGLGPGIAFASRARRHRARGAHAGDGLPVRGPHHARDHRRRSGPRSAPPTTRPA